MHLAPPIVRTLLEAVLALVLASMIGALTWAFPRLVRGDLAPGPLVPRRASWGVLVVVAVLLTYLVLSLTIGSVVGEALGRVPPPPGETGPDRPTFTATMLAATLINVAVVLVVPPLVTFLSRACRADLGLSFAQWRADLIRGVLAFLFVTPWVYVLFGIARFVYHGERHPLEKMLREETSVGGVVLAVLSAVVFAPLAEELLFRGVIQGWLNRVMLAPDDREFSPEPSEVPSNPARARASAWLPVVASSALFAGLHAPEMPAPIAIFPLAIVLGYLYQSTGRLTASITLHACFNGFSTLLLFLSVL